MFSNFSSETDDEAASKRRKEKMVEVECIVCCGEFPQIRMLFCSPYVQCVLTDHPIRNQPLASKGKLEEHIEPSTIGVEGKSQA